MTSGPMPAPSVTDIAFRGTRGSREHATLVQPPVPPVAGVVLAHGGSDDGRRFFLSEAVALAGHGLAVVLSATQLPEHGDAGRTRAALDRALTVYQRALDLLAERVGATSLGFAGHSAGAFLGTLLLTADQRVRAAVLAGYGSGTLVRIARHELAGRPDAEGYLAWLDRFDPRHHLTRATARVLLQSGRADDTVPTAEVAALAVPPVEWREYGCGHALDADVAQRDRREFLLATLT